MIVSLKKKKALTTVEIDIHKHGENWILNLIAYGEWITESFQKFQDCVNFIEEGWVILSDDEKNQIRNMKDYRLGLGEFCKSKNSFIDWNFQCR